jgi:ribosome-associated toxin RatA of RatAB toxin-antitoxin module
MSTVSREAIVRYTCQQMFELVNDVAAYPDFLPWCSASEVFSESDKQMQASLSIKKGLLKQTFATSNTLEPYSKLSMELSDGPFEQMQGDWLFAPLGQNEEACKISFTLDFTFKSYILSKTLTPIFNDIANKMIQAFSQRAAQIHGEIVNVD